jgi:hypothetical protein
MSNLPKPKSPKSQPKKSKPDGKDLLESVGQIQVERDKLRAKKKKKPQLPPQAETEPDSDDV